MEYCWSLFVHQIICLSWLWLKTHDYFLFGPRPKIPNITNFSWKQPILQILYATLSFSIKVEMAVDKLMIINY